MTFIKALFTLFFLALLQDVSPVLDTEPNSNIAVYWGQGGSDSSLAEYCDDYPQEIKTCQAQGKTIMLSIGGATYTEGGFPSELDAINSANTVWQTLGPSTPESQHCSFGDAVTDGFDFDLESPVNNMPAFGNRLRELMNGQLDGAYYLTAAPPFLQCPFPDKKVGDALKNVQLDAIFVQFYNNPQCGLNAFANGAPTGFNFDQWAREESVSKGVTVTVGAPGIQDAAPSSGYVDAGQLGEIVEYSKPFSSMGDVMVWDASHLRTNLGPLGSIKKLAEDVLGTVGWVFIG